MTIIELRARLAYALQLQQQARLSTASALAAAWALPASLTVVPDLAPPKQRSTSNPRSVARRRGRRPLHVSSGVLARRRPAPALPTI